MATAKGQSNLYTNKYTTCRMKPIGYPILLAAFIIKALDPEGTLRKRLAEEAKERTRKSKISYGRKTKKRS